MNTPRRVAAQRVRATRLRRSAPQGCLDALRPCRRKRRLEGLRLRAMVMGLCLLVYTLGQRQLRQALAHYEETIPNRLKQPTSTPTLRWVFQCFQAVYLLVLDRQLQISNLTDTRVRILRFLGSPCQKYYLVC